MSYDLQLEAAKERIEQLEKSLASFIERYNIDKQQYIEKDPSISSGNGTKIYYNDNGLVNHSENLTQDDIPQLDMNKINGLQDVIDQKCDQSTLRHVFEELVDNRISNMNVTKMEPVNSGTKVNVDEFGRVVGLSNLTIEDVPDIPINKVTGLQDCIELIQKSTNPSDYSQDDFKTNPGTGCKVSWDNKGRVIGYDKLTIDDMPQEMVERLTRLEEMITEKVENRIFQTLRDLVGRKIDRNESTKSGTYTKCLVDDNGLVIGGDKLNKDDLPLLTIDDIDNLREELSNKIESRVIEELSSRIDDIRKVEPKLVERNDDGKLHEMNLKVDHIESLLNELLVKLPSDEINDQINSLNEQISTLEGKLSVLERKIDNK